MDELLRKLIEVPGVSGCEDRVRACIESHLPPGMATATDSMGNLVVTLGSGEGGPLFVAHMDEIGFVVSEVREDGYLRLKPLGGIDPRTVFGRSLRVITQSREVAGVLAVKPPHLMQDRKKEMGEVPAVTDLLLDIGARSAEEVEALGVKVLDFAVVSKQPLTLHGGLLCARALDDRLGCAILLRALERLAADPPEGPVRFAFSVQEEVGVRGAALLAHSLRPELAFAVDSVSSADWPGAERRLSPAELGRGVCLRVIDNSCIVPPAFRRELVALAAEEKIALQTVFSGGGTDARAFQPEGARVMALAFPVRYTHSCVELAHPGDVEATIRFVCAIARRYA